MRHGTIFLFLVCAMLVACSTGGSSSSNGTEQIQNLNLGVVRADEPTTTALPLMKPFYDAATIELAATPIGPFAPATGMLPMYVDRGEQPTLYVTFYPALATAGAMQAGTMELVFRRESDGATMPVTVNLSAQVETAPSVRVLTSHFDMGGVAIGESVPFVIHVENTSKATPVVVDSVTADQGFALAPNAYGMPCPVAPDGRFFVKMVYAPQTEGYVATVVHIQTSASPQPLEITVTGTGIAPSVLFDYGLVPLDASYESDWLTLDLEPEAVSMRIEAWGDPASVIDLIGLQGPSGVTYETYDMSGPLDWMSNYPAGALGYLNVVVPDSTEPAVQLVPDGGGYRFRLRDSASAATGLFVQVTVLQRHRAKAQEGTLDLRVFLAAGLPLTDPANPMSDPKLSSAIKTIDAVLGASGIRLGNVIFEPLDASWDTINTPQQAEDLVAVNTAGQPEGALNLFYVTRIAYGITGIAGADPGPTANGTPFSGVVVDYNESKSIYSGATAAHEIAHYLGADGGGVILSEDAAYPALRHPLVNPGLPAELVSPPETTNMGQIEYSIGNMGSMGVWCGTCTRPSLR